MQLHPKRPPGRIDRKAAAYAPQIAELRSAGYTYEAIREALLDVGVVASTSALRREMQRLRSANRPSAFRTAPGPPTPALAPLPSVSPLFPAAHADPSAASGRDVAEAFFNAHPSNPLLRFKEPP
jgi:hypothetical protein